VSSNQNNSNDEPNAHPANGQIELPAHQSTPIENIQVSFSETPPVIPEIPPSTNDQTELTMEVHHHGHVHETKKWKEYLFQFFMLFLAVFCGFLAEYQLEHKIEKEKGRQYVQSFYGDLHDDTASLKATIFRAREIVSSIDSATQLFMEEKFDSASVKQLYQLNLGYLGGLGAVLTDRTSSQLKNSGGMRLIDDEEIIAKIIDYWSGAQLTVAIENDYNDWRAKARDKSYSIFDSRYYSKNQTNLFSGSPVLMTRSSGIFIEFYNRLTHIRNLLYNRYIPKLEDQIDKAEKLMKVINDY